MKTEKDLFDTIDRISGIGGSLYQRDFLATRDFNKEELVALINAAQCLKYLRDGLNLSTRAFDSGKAVSIFRDNSTRTRSAFDDAADLMGLSLMDIDEGKSQIAHGETARETAIMVSFLADVVGVRDDKYIGFGHRDMQDFARFVDEGHREGVLPQRPIVINLQSDVDHKTQALADLANLVETFGSFEALEGKKFAMTWAHSPSYGKPLSVPQGLIMLMPRFGMDVVLAHPEGYNLLPDVMGSAYCPKNDGTERGTGSFQAITSPDAMSQAFNGADIVYPKSWGSMEIMQRRADYYRRHDKKLKEGGLTQEEFSRLEEDLEEECKAQNAKHIDWECTESMMDLTRDGDALYMHCLPADISGVSCDHGEVQEEVFDRYRDATYKQAGWKPYIIAAMILCGCFEKPEEQLRKMYERKAPRKGA